MAIARVLYGTTIVPPNIVRATIYSFVNGQIGLMDVSYTALSSTLGGCTSGDLAFAIQTDIDGALASLMSSSVFLLGTKVSFLPPFSHFGPGIASSTSVGTAGTQLLPTQTRGLIRWTANAAGPPYRGRVFVPFPDVSDVGATNAQPTAGYVTRLTGLAGFLYGVTTVIGLSGASTTFALSIYHRKAGKSGVPVAQSATTATGFIPSVLWATQRRSGDRGRKNVGVIT